MDFELMEEQRILQKSARDFLAKECPKSLVRELDESPDGHSHELWEKMVGLGWQGLILPEEFGGSQWTFLDLTILFEEMGKGLCPGPYFSTVLLGALPVLQAGTDQQKKELLPLVAAGKTILTMALTEAEGGLEPSGIQTRAEGQGDDFVLNGTKLFVPDAHLADKMLTAARTGEGGPAGEGLTVFLVDSGLDGLSVEPLETIARDRQCEVRFENVRVPASAILGRENQGWPVIARTLEYASIGRAAEMVGQAQAAMDMALAYTKERTQFGRPIGSFQAMQHYMADMWLDVNGARNLVYKAAWKASQGWPVGQEAAMAKAKAGLVCRKTTTVSHRIFGAISFTMEHDLHLYHRRVLCGDMAFGSSEAQLEKVAQGLGL
jgi:alkylation response protein AidB-like acyl-CoA dehydrogenase